jgi:hypothetical protein
MTNCYGDEQYCHLTLILHERTRSSTNLHYEMSKKAKVG